jgi:hypothetical protein
MAFNTPLDFSSVVDGLRKIRTCLHQSFANDSAKQSSIVRLITTLGWLAMIAVGSSHFLVAQDLAPRAYVITPLQSNAVTLTWAFYDGGLNFTGTIPIVATGTYNVPIVSYYHSLSFFGRSANISTSLPYGVGTFKATALGKQRSAYRSGLLDLSVRFTVNLIGGPSMQAEQFSRWRQKTLLGISLRMIAPTGQYSSTQLINWGINRWALKPEIGYSRRWGNWVLDGYGGAWFYTANPADFHVPHPVPQTQEPIGSFEGHLSRDFGRGTWISLDGNFWMGWRDDIKWRTEPGDAPNQLAPRGHGGLPGFQASVDKS